MKITVYSYWTWVPGEGLGKVACKKRSAEQIEALQGIPIPTSGEEVDLCDLCSDGAYRPLPISVC